MLETLPIFYNAQLRNAQKSHCMKPQPSVETTKIYFTLVATDKGKAEIRNTSYNKISQKTMITLHQTYLTVNLAMLTYYINTFFFNHAKYFH